MIKNSGNVLLKSTLSSSESRRFSYSRVVLWVASIGRNPFCGSLFPAPISRPSEPLRDELGKPPNSLQFCSCEPSP